MAPLWEAVAELDPDQQGERAFQGGSRESLVSILEGSGLGGVESVELAVTVTPRRSRDGGSPTSTASGPRER